MMYHNYYTGDLNLAHFVMMYVLLHSKEVQVRSTEVTVLMYEKTGKEMQN